LPGFAVYPYQLEHGPSLTDFGAHKKMAEIATSILTVRAERLVINISVHKSQTGYEAGGFTYTASQLVATFILPAVMAFRDSHHRLDPSRVVVLNCCDVSSGTCPKMVDDAPADYTLEMVTFRNPMLLHKMPGVCASFTREFCNRIREQTFTTADCLGSTINWEFERHAAPVLLSRGRAPVVAFVAPFITALASFSPSAAAAALSPPLRLHGQTSEATISSRLLASPGQPAMCACTRVGAHYQTDECSVDFPLLLSPASSSSGTASASAAAAAPDPAKLAAVSAAAVSGAPAVAPLPRLSSKVRNAMVLRTHRLQD
jgi:hypothetical protein